MVVTILLLLVAVFALSRAMAIAAAKSPQLAIYVGAATSAALLAGILLDPLIRGGVAAPVPSAVPAATVPIVSPIGKAIAPKGFRLTNAQLYALVPSSTRAIGYVDSLNGFGLQTGDQQFSTGKPIRADGWVADPTTRKPADGIFLILDGRRRIDGTANYGRPRRDVADMYATAAMTDTGFRGVEIPTEGAAKGPHILQLAAVASDHATYYVATPLWRFELR